MNKTIIKCPHCGETIAVISNGFIDEVFPIFAEVDTEKDVQLALTLGVVLADKPTNEGR